ncbi:hypothetical protein [Methanobacterium sp.]|uniref:hypothetical protein n=1 Tax=Methanobacterium sp. TaxID=2164 RepID=UPI003C794C67
MKFKRFIWGLFLIIILFLLCGNYSFNENYCINSTTKELLYNYPENQIFIFGTVTAVYKGGFEVLINKNGNLYIYKVKSLSNVNLGDTVYLTGALNSSNAISSIRLINVNNSDFHFVILRSIFGMILYLIIFGKYWKFDLKRMIVTRRN